MGSKESFHAVQVGKMVESHKIKYRSWKKEEGVGNTLPNFMVGEEGKKIGKLSWKKEEGVVDTLPSFIAAQKGCNTGNQITPEKILKLRGNRDFLGYIREKYGDCDGARIKFCYRAVTSKQLDVFLKGPMSEKERDRLFLPTNGAVVQGSYFSTNPRREAGYCSSEGSKILVKVIIYMGEEDYFLNNCELCLRSTADCYPTHIIFLNQTSRMSLGKYNLSDVKIERKPESESEPEESKVVRTIKSEPKKIKVAIAKKPEAEESKVVGAPKRNYVSQKDIVSISGPVWSVKVEGGEMMEYSRKQSEEIETIYQRWQQSTNTQKWKNNTGKLSKEGEWTYEISFNEYNPNSWTQENTTTEKKRFIWRRIKCSVVDAEKVPPLPYSWSYKVQEGVYNKYCHLHQVEIEDIFQRWRAGGCGRGNLSRDMGGNIEQDYGVEFVSIDKSTWIQGNLETKYSRSLRREPDIDVSERIDKEPNRELLIADNPEFKEVSDKFMSAQTHGDLMEVGSIWKIKKVAGELAFMEKIIRGEANTYIKTLYHGTTEENILSIIYETDKTGFLKSEKGMLGSGVYFAPDPGKTKYYSKDNQDFLLIAKVNLEDNKYRQDKIYDEYCVPFESLAVPTHILRYNIKCLLCGLFINNGDTERTQLGGVHIVHTSCWQKRNNYS